MRSKSLIKELIDEVHMKVSILMRIIFSLGVRKIGQILNGNYQ